MKIRKIIPLLFTAPLLFGCDKVEEPKFKKISDADEVTYEAFKEAFLNASKEHALVSPTSEKALPSHTVKAEMNSVTTTTAVRGKDTITDSKSTSKDTLEIESDANDGVAKVSSTSSRVLSTKQNQTKLSLSAKNKYVEYLQKESKEDKEYLAIVNPKEKTIDYSSELSETYKYSLAFDDATSDYYYNESKVFSDFLYHSSWYEGDSTTYYVTNNKIFTVEYSYSKQDEELKTWKGDSSYGTQDTDKLTKVQISFEKENEVKYSYYKEYTERIEYTKASSGYAAGDVVTYVEKSSYEQTNTKKDVKVKSQDASKCVEIDGSSSSLYY